MATKAAEVQYRYLVEPLAFPVDGYNYLVSTVTSVDGGRTFWYCGNSRYFRSKEEAEAYRAAKESE